jgi:murein tripeptide amidase MpaA
MSTTVSISDAFDGGNIKFVEQDGSTVVLEIKPDPFTELEQKSHLQYFCFRVICSSTTNADADTEIDTDSIEPLTYVIANANQASFPEAWEGTTVFFAPTLNDPNAWKRIASTTYCHQTGQLSWTHTQSGFFAYFPPYSYNRHLDLIAKCGSNVMSLGKTLEGRELDCVKLGVGEKICWLIHRQHPGETMAEYFAEGLLERLLGINGSVDGLVAQLLQKYTFYIVPNMCPDGSVHGYLRTNAGGHNLNREWAPSLNYDAPTLERSPEVYHVLHKMQETGVDAFLDVHGDEELPFNFLAGSEGLPNWGPRLQGLHGAFMASYSRANADMQPHFGYAPDAPNASKPIVASNQVGQRFDCFASTLEMPYKDCYTNPDPERGWTPARSKQLGASVLDALSYIYPYLRDDTEFWTTMRPKDTYVCPTPNYKNAHDGAE